MAEQAHIGSIDDIALFRAQFLTFLSGARAAVEECGVDVAHQQSWLEHDRRRHWEAEAARRQRKLEEARQSLFQESISTQRGPASWHQMQVHRAERALEEAQGKLQRIRLWSRDLENRSLPMVKQVERLHTILTIDMARAVNHLNQILATLDAYTSRAPGSPPPSDAAAASNAPEAAPDGAKLP